MSVSQSTKEAISIRNLVIRFGFLVLLLGLVIYFSFAADGFSSPQSAVFILQSVSITGILALGVTATLVVGGFDLSIGSVATTALMASSYVMVVMGGDALTATLVCIAIGILVGLINGVLIVYMRVPDLLATLGMMFLLLGLQRIPTEGRSIATGMALPDGSIANGTFSPNFLALGRHRFDFILPNLVPVSVVVLIVLSVADLVLPAIHPLRADDVCGRLQRARSPARRCPGQCLQDRRLCDLGHLRLDRRRAAGRPTRPWRHRLRQQSAAGCGGRRADRLCVLGAAKPNAFGTAIGALFVGILLQGLTMMNAPYYTQDFVKGAVLVIALVFTFALSQRARK
jgi:simple sugar transport system permease protein